MSAVATLLLRFGRAWLRAGPTLRRIVTTITIIWILVLWIGRLAPHDFHRPVPVSTINVHTQWGNPCSSHAPQFDRGAGWIVSAAEVNDAGPYKAYVLMCSNGVQVDWQQ